MTLVLTLFVARQHQDGTTEYLLPDEIQAVQEAYFVKDDTVYGLDLTSEQTARQMMMSSLGRSVSQSLADAACGSGPAGFWTRPFGAYFFSEGSLGNSNLLTNQDVFVEDFNQYDPTNTYAAFEGSQAGSLFGTCAPAGTFGPAQYFAGFSYGRAGTTDAEHFDSETYGGLAGFRGSYLDAFSYSLVGGYLRHETDHQIADNRREQSGTGLEAISDTYDTWFLMPSIDYAYELEAFDLLSQLQLSLRYLGTLQTERKLQLDDDVAAIVEEAFAHELSARAELHAPLADETGRLRIGAEVLWSQGEYGLEIGGQSVTDISSAFDEFTYRGIIGADIGPVSFEIGYDNNEIFDLTASLKFPL